MKALELLLPPPLIAFLSALLMYFVAKPLPIIHITWQAKLIISTLLMLLALTIGLSAIIAFVRHKTTANPKRPSASTKLVMTGIYRYSRNPMYLAILCLLLAWAVYLQSLFASIGIIFYLLYITRFQIMPEERVLGSKFKAEFSAYKQQVRRWL
ncbi:methyltransferase family protein [Oligella urethralis]|uniref:methyltransferase family protein n=1 Tax=Oligella urethralis TaxID=90245 RepID=UPI0003659579|nr:isoprenylcysteine carboxylmethyltransferase family protein [Oligella urethralis]AVL71701.1 isoprenylcysteine carboxylmethyltransferase family protein [Oligella urethralis]